MLKGRIFQDPHFLDSAMWTLLTRIARLTGTVAELLRLPVAELQFYGALDPERIAATYRSFTMPHPTYRIIGRKTIGAALLDLTRYPHAQAYLQAIGKRNFGGYFARRASARGYRFTEIDRNRYIDGIDDINRSLPFRQGRIMAPSYRERTEHFIDHQHYRYYGVLAPDGKLMAYCEVGMYGNFALLSRLLGYRNNDGVMHFMIVEIVSLLIREGLVRYIMYDTWFGATEGLRNFKSILGFQPYRVRYSLDTARAAQPPRKRLLSR